MASANRTASAKWKRLRARKISEALRLGLVNCPTCGRPFAFGTFRQPLSPELSHVIPVRLGGEDSDENTFLECYQDNRGRGAKVVTAAEQAGSPGRSDDGHPVVPFPLQSQW